MKNVLKTILLLTAIAMAAAACGPKKDAKKADEAKPEAVKEELAIQLFVMSKCPYGVKAVEAMKPAADLFGGQVGLHIDYIGQKKPDGSLSSMHGPDEVQGNINQLCAKEVAADKYWAFMDCVNKENKWRAIPNNSDACVKEAGIDKTKFTACTTGEKGKELLGASIDKAKSNQATGSPTIIIGGEKYRGARSEQAIAHFICNKFGKDKNLKYCADMPAPPEITMYAITDKRCGKKCATQGMIANLEKRFFGLKAQTLDWSDDAAKVKPIADATETKMLPAYIFDASVEKDKASFEQMQRWLVKKGDYYVLRAGRPAFDPEAEICDNGKDDTGNGKVDCDDETCNNTLECRTETPKTLEVFVMSQCPFGAMAVNAMGEVLDNFKADMDFKINFIGNIADDKISSMHGQSEVDENKRWACAAKLYPKDYLKYVWCRAEDYKNPDWEKCATGPINADKIKKCFETEGDALLKENMEIATGLGIGASPTWVVNGKTKFSGVTPRVIQQNFCKANADLAEKEICTKPLSSERPTKAPAGSCGG